MGRPNRCEGFTLIELLVVIAIIAILAAILFPVFSQVRDKARQASCTSNLKQLGLAYSMYREDYDGHFPPAWSFPNGWNQCPQLTWMDFCQPYIRNVQIFACPSRAQNAWVWTTPAARRDCPPVIAQWGSPPLGSVENPFRLGYVYNEGYDEGQEVPGISCTPGGGSPSRWNPCYWGMVSHEALDPVRGFTVADVGAHDASFEEPATTIALIDGNPNCDKNNPQFTSVVVFRIFRDTEHLSPRGGCFETVGNETRKVGRLDRRHSDGFNMSFADGHVKWVRRSLRNWWTRMADAQRFRIAYGEE